MKEFSEDDVFKKIDECAGKNEAQLIEELKKVKEESDTITDADFDAFKEAVLPMLNERQIERLEEIRKLLKND